MNSQNRIVRVLSFLTLLVIFGIAATGYAGPEAAELSEELAGEESTAPAGAGLMIAAALVAMVILGSPLFVIIGVLAALCFMLYGEPGLYEVSACTSLDPEVICGFDKFPQKMAGLTTKNVLLAIPFFVVSGAIMSAGDIANRLVAFAKALVGWLPGGLAVATVGACIFFAAISGSSPVTVIAIGTMMYPALTKAGYQSRFSMGLVTTAGSLGILIPPSIPMLVFAIVVGGVDIGELFMAGIMPGVLIGVLLSIYSMWIATTDKIERTPFDLMEVFHRFRDGFWAIMLPVLILGGIYSGTFTATEAAAVSVIYALVVELAIHRELRFEDLPKVLSESAVLMGTLLIIMVLAFALNDFLVEEKIPDMAVEQIRAMNLGPLQFLLMINVMLLLVGALMDSISAILIIAPLLKPIAEQFGIDPVHLAVIFIVNLEIGYLTPPIGINLFVASSVFRKPLGEIIKSVVPFIMIMFVGLGIVTYVPTVALGPVNIFLRDKPFYEPLPQLDESGQVIKPGAPKGPDIKKPGEAAADGEGRVFTMAEMTELSGQINALCYAAEDVMDDEVEPAERLATWRENLEDEGVDNEFVVEVAALVDGLRPDVYPKVKAAASKLLKKEDWECEALDEMLKSDGAAEEPAKDEEAADSAAEPAAGESGAAGEGSGGAASGGEGSGGTGAPVELGAGEAAETGPG
ncbi:MAG: TRAP transporter large permease subunit [Myxococcota bacterium]